MSKSLVNYYVLSEWDLTKEMLNIYFEKDEKQQLIKKIDFKINKRSKEKFDVFLNCIPKSGIDGWLSSVSKNKNKNLTFPTSN